MASPLAQALAFQGSVTPPQGRIANTDVIGAYQNEQAAKQKNYETQMAQQNAIFGGLAGLGGAALMGPMGGLGGLGKLFGGGAAAGLSGMAGNGGGFGQASSMAPWGAASAPGGFQFNY